NTGSFTVSGLPSGQTTIDVTAPQGTVLNEPSPVTVSSGQNTAVPPVADIPLSTVNGSVTDSSGQPVAGVTVTVTGTTSEGTQYTTQAITSGGGIFSVT